MRRSLLITAVAACATLLAAPVVDATSSWGPITSTYNGSEVVRGSGSFTDGGANASATMTVQDSKNDGNSVYGKTRFQYKFYNTGTGSYVWSTWETKSTGGFSNTTKSFSWSSAVPGGSQDERGSVQVCAQLGFPVPDSCQSAIAN